MELLEAMKKRHSVRQYVDKAIDGEVLSELLHEIEACNKEGDLNIQLVLNEPQAFSGFMAHYGNFSGVTNYLALVGKKCKDLDEKCGYYGERLVLKAQQLGLNTCWVALTYKKIPSAFKVEKDEKLTVVISIGYGRNRGLVRKSKTAKQVSNVSSSSPEWFKTGVAATLLAPTAINQQKFYLKLNENKVFAKAGIGPCAKMDLGIVKYHFEIGAGKENFIWE